MIKAVIFDCFGVLIRDSLKEYRDKLSSSDRETVEGLLYASHRGLIKAEDSRRQIAELFGITPEEYHGTFNSSESKNVELINYILKLKDKYKTAMLSNISIGGLEVRFTPEELETHFDAVVASGEIGYAKPEPRAYEIVAERLGVRLDECVFTDDVESYCEAARSVGMRAFVYKSFDQAKCELDKLLA